MPNPNLPIGGQYNVYTGARYVPLIMGAWSETVAYEPLSVVTYLGNSYTSRTFVPAGVAPTNETYWAATGNYNAQVEQYRQEVEQLAGDVADIQADIAGLNKKAKYLVMCDKTGQAYVSYLTGFLNLQSSQYETVINPNGDFNAVLPQNNWQNIILTADPSFTPDIIVLNSCSTEWNLTDAVTMFAQRAFNRWPDVKIYLQVFYSNRCTGLAVPNLTIVSSIRYSLYPLYSLTNITDAFVKEMALFTYKSISGNVFEPYQAYPFNITVNSQQKEVVIRKDSMSTVLGLGGSLGNVDIGSSETVVATHDLGNLTILNYLYTYPSYRVAVNILPDGNLTARCTEGQTTGAVLYNSQFSIY